MWRCKKYDTPDWEAILLQASIWKQLRTGRKAECPVLLFTAVTLATLQIPQWDAQLDVTFFRWLNGRKIALFKGCILLSMGILRHFAS